MARKADIAWTGGNGFYTIQILSKKGRRWFDDNVATEGWQWLGNTLGIDSADLLTAIVNGAENDGLEVA